MEFDREWRVISFQFVIIRRFTSYPLMTDNFVRRARSRKRQVSPV